MWLKPGIVAASGATFPPATFTMSQLSSANQIYQRDTVSGGGQSKGQGTIPVTVSVSASGAIYARRRSIDGSNTILQAPWLVNSTVSTATTSLNVTGVDAPAFTSSALPAATNDGWFYLDLSADGTTWQSGTTAVCVGDLTSFAGQSLTTCFFNRDGYDTTNTIATVFGSDAYVSDYGRVFVAYDGNINHYPTNPVTAAAPASMTWAKPATGGTYDSTFVVEFLKRMIAADGVAHGAIGYTHSGTKSHSWNPNLSGSDMALHKAVQAVAAPRGWRREFWYQGHSDAGFGSEAIAYIAGLGTLGLALTGQTPAATGFSGNNAFAGTVKRYIGAYPMLNSTVFGTARQADRIRNGGKKFANDNGWTYVDAADVDLVSPGIHEGSSLTSGVAFARDVYRTMGTTAGAIGPQLVSATRASGSKDVYITLANAGTSLVGTGTWYQRFKVFNAGSFSQWTISSGTIVSPTQVKLTLLSDPGDGQALDIRANWLAEGTLTVNANMLRDDRTEGDGITVGRPIVPYFNSTTLSSAISCAAPGTGTTNTPNTVYAPTSTFDMTMTTPTYSTAGAELVPSFGTYLVSGSGTAAGNGGLGVPGQYNTGMTMEMFFSVSALPGSTSAIMSYGGSGGVAHLSLTSAGRLSVQGSGGPTSDSTGGSVVASATGDVIAAGKVYHVALMAGPHGTTAFCKNITDGINFTPVTQGNAWFGTAKNCKYSVLSINGSVTKLTTGSASHQAIWDSERWLSGGSPAASHTPPSSPLTGNEAGLIALYRYNGDGTDAVKAA